MPKKNLIAFVVVAALLIAGWWLFRPEPAVRQANVQNKDKKAPSKEKAAEEPAKSKEIAKEPVKKEPDEERKEKAPAVAAAKPPPEEPVQILQLGDPKVSEYFILADITTRGGGISKLTLPKFDKVNENGRPVFNPDGSNTSLQLIENDPFLASFLMYHYADPNDNTEKAECVTTLGQQIWKVERNSTTPSESEIVLSSISIPGYPRLRIVKTYTLRPREYHIGLNVEIRDERDSKDADKKARPFRYQLSGSHGMPIEGIWYTPIYRTPMIGILNEKGYLERNLDETQYRIATKGGGERIPPDSLGKSKIQYAGVATQYFSSLIVPDDKQVAPFLSYCRPTLETEEIAGIIEAIDIADPNGPKLYMRTKEAVPQKLVFSLLPRTKRQLDDNGFAKGDDVLVNFYDPVNGTPQRVATAVHAGHVPRLQLDDITVRVVSQVLELEPGKSAVHKFMLYHGPSKVRLLADFHGDEAVKPELVEEYAYKWHLETLTDYRSAGPFGWFASKIMWTDVLIMTTRFMHWLLYWLHALVGNYGLTIILLTVLVRGSMFPISRRSAMLSQRMQALAPEIKKVQEKYKDNPQAKTAAVMELYRKHGVNPFGSCLPMIMQMPFFLGLYYCLQESIHFRLASFWPLWIDNLAAPDMLIRWGNGIPIISDPDNMSGNFLSFLYLGPYFNILPVIAVALMLMQQKMMTPPPADEQQEMQQKMMKYMFVFIGVMFYKVAAGLCVYFIVSSLWGLCERKMLPKKKLLETAPAPVNNSKQLRGKAKADKKEKKPDNTVQKVKDWWAELLKQAEKK